MKNIQNKLLLLKECHSFFNNIIPSHTYERSFNLQVLIVDLMLRRRIAVYVLTILKESILIAALVTMLHIVASYLTWLGLLLRVYLSLLPLSHAYCTTLQRTNGSNGAREMHAGYPIRL